MKVLFVQKMAGISGSERYYLNILPELNRRGVNAEFLVVQHPNNSSKNYDFISQLRANNVDVYVINSRLSISPWLICKIAKLIREKSVDILHTNLIHADFWGACIKFFLIPKLPIVSVKHGYSESYQTKYGLDPKFIKYDLMFILTYWSARQSDFVVSISAALGDFLVKAGLVPDYKSKVIPYGFDFSHVNSVLPIGKVRFGSPQIIVPGRLVAVKQHHLLIRIIPELVEIFPSIAVVMVGAGPLLDELKTECEKLGVSQYVYWEGFRDNVHDYLRDSDLVVLPSAAEGFGLVVLEAWFQAKSVIAFDVPAINEIVDQNENGILIMPFDTEELLNALKDLLSDHDILNLMGNAGKNKQINVYGLNAMCEKIIDVYRSVLSFN